MQNNQAPSKRYRVVQWATGNVGARSLRQAMSQPEMDLVGVYVHSPSKIGRDAGELASVENVGVRAIGSIEEVLELRPDCVLYMPHVLDYGEVCRLLEAGVNIVTTRMEFQNPRALDEAMAQRVQEACERGRSSIHATGSSPGFITEAVPLVLGSLQTKLRKLSILEFADVSMRNSPEMIFEMMGFGKQVGPAAEGHLEHARTSFGPSLQLVATAFGLPLDRVEAHGSAGVARDDVTIAAGVVPKGTVAATRVTVTGYREGRELISFTSTWFVSTEVDTTDGEEWEFRTPAGWRIVVDGDMPLDVSISFPVPSDDYAEVIPGLTAHRPINAVRYVCEAEPGIRTTTDLPQIIPVLSQHGAA